MAKRKPKIKKKTKFKKSTHAIVDQRVSKIADMLLSGYTRSIILRYIAENTDWKVKTRQVENYIQKANDRITKDNLLQLSRNKILAVARYLLIFREAMEKGDYSNAIKAHNSVDNITGVKAPDKIEATVLQENITDDEIDQIMKKYDVDKRIKTRRSKKDSVASAK
jgi:hypothetical protein